MKFFTILFFSIAMSFQSWSQTVNFKDLGGKGDGKTDNSKAFAKLNAWIKKNRSGKIIIPNGVYIFKLQKEVPSNSGNAWSADPALHLENVSNIIIEGNNATFRTQAGQLFGAFDKKTKLKIETKLPYTDPSTRAALGYTILVGNSNNVIIRNLNLDGNASQLKIGGKWGDTGYQIEHYGFYIQNSKNITIENSSANNFALDGLLISNATPEGVNTPSQNIVINNFKALYNGRQGLSWTGGSGVFVKNSEFSHTGRGKVQSAPSSGLDIEPEGGKMTINGKFINTKFINNVGTAFVTDYGMLVNNILFDNCEFSGISNFIIVANGNNMRFNNSRIDGIVIPGSRVSKDSVIFDNCVFTDSLIKNNGASNYLIDGGGGAFNYTIKNSTFRLKYKRAAWLHPISLVSGELPYVNFINNRIYLNYPTVKSNNFIGVFRFTNFNSNQVICSSITENNSFNFFIIEFSKTDGKNKIITNNAPFRWTQNSSMTDRFF